jgi:hypothetical protein
MIVRAMNRKNFFPSHLPGADGTPAVVVQERLQPLAMAQLGSWVVRGWLCRAWPFRPST